METDRRQFLQRALSFLGLVISAPLLLSLSQCRSNENEALNSLRNILNAVDSALKALIALGLAHDTILAAAKYLESVTTFVNTAAETLEDAALSTAQKAAKILQAGNNVALQHFDDPKVRNILQTVQAAVAAFLSFFQPAKPTEVKVEPRTKKVLDDIEQDAQKENADIVKWAANPAATPTK